MDAWHQAEVGAPLRTVMVQMQAWTRGHLHPFPCSGKAKTGKFITLYPSKL